MDFASNRIIASGVARLTGFYEKATGVRERNGRKKTMNITDTIAGRDLEALRAAAAISRGTRTMRR
jgi:hypothetical protein